MSPFCAEFVGTALLIILGDGVVANVVLDKTKGNNGGLIAITLGWAIAVFVAVYVAAPFSGAHLNPAVTLALATIRRGDVSYVFDPSLIGVYISAQLLGAMTGALVVWVLYRLHFNETNDAKLKLAVFCTAPAIRKAWDNLLSEIIGTFVFILGVLFIMKPQQSLGALDALPVALLVLSIGLSLGGPTGYAINPARDLGPRIMHAILPIKGKGSSEWSYSWIPVLGPVVGAILAAIVYAYLHDDYFLWLEGKNA